ncbi:GAF domain-containing protein [Balneolales bacterium ANBcel1]|nr:GAF domain-containing protein [Balneolales bacterium ANBcel1]
MTQKEIPWDLLLKKSRDLIRDAADREEAMQHICALLHREVPHYDWVGFYMVDPLADRQLVLGPYVGEPTEHTRIPFGQGICGQAAETQKTFVVQDVSKETNYLACSPMVQSEIVVPIMKGNELIGEIDIDSEQRGVMSNSDRKLLEAIADELAELF